MSSGESCNDDGDDDTVHCHDGLVKRNAIEVAVLVPFWKGVKSKMSNLGTNITITTTPHTYSGSCHFVLSSTGLQVNFSLGRDAGGGD